MCECNKGHWVKHEKLVKCSIDYVHGIYWTYSNCGYQPCDYAPDIYWTCSVCGYQPYEGADYDRKNHLSNFCPNCGKKWNIMNNINGNYLSSFLLGKLIIDC